MKTLNELWSELTFVAVDFETTGLHAHDCQAIEVGVVRYEGGVCVDVVETFLECKAPLPKVITEITSITDAMLVGAPPFAQVFTSLNELLLGMPILAFNASFDRKFLTAEFMRTDAEVVPPYLHPSFKWIDPCTWARAIQTEHTQHKLGMVASRYGLVSENLHRAGDDAKLAGDVMLAMMHKHPGHFEGTLEQLIDKQETLAGRHAVIRTRGSAKAAVVCDICGESQPIRNGSKTYAEAFYCSVTCRNFAAEISTEVAADAAETVVDAPEQPTT